MKNILIAFLVMLGLSSGLHASQSVITESEGSICMGDDKSRKESESLAFKEASRRAAEYASTHIRSETHVKDSALENDLISAYANATVKVLQELEKGWYRDSSSGECFRIRLKVEVVPDPRAIARVSEKALFDDPAGPLSVRIWTDRKEYGKGQQVRIYLKGNKPFYGRVVYRDAQDKLVQLLPNPYRSANYFNGGVVYEIPGNDDRFDLEVTPPFGIEEVTVYASTASLGAIESVPSGGVLEIRNRPEDVVTATRGVKLVAKGSGHAAQPAVAEFAEAKAILKTTK
jgi:hypothetical protein